MGAEGAERPTQATGWRVPLALALACSLLLVTWLGGCAAMRPKLDLPSMWNFEKPDESEARFRAALRSAQGDDALVLRTQIARSLGLRSRFAEAHAELDAIEPLLAGAGAEPKVRALLERGRVLRSARNPEAARPLFEQAFTLADAAGLEDLAGDALHMVALVAPDTDAQVAGNRRVLAYARAARDPAARRWEAVALNNLGVVLNAAERHAEALDVLTQALEAYRQRGNPRDVRIARWMVAHTLRRLGRLDEALAQQLELERDAQAAGAPDAYVFDELSRLYRVLGQPERAAHYEGLRAATAQR